MTSESVNVRKKKREKERTERERERALDRATICSYTNGISFEFIVPILSFSYTLWPKQTNETKELKRRIYGSKTTKMNYNEAKQEKTIKLNIGWK